MKGVVSAVALTVALTAETAHAEDFELRVIGGSVQLGGQIVISVRDPSGKEVGRVTDIYPYNNQFSELRILVKNVRNPVSAGDRFEAVVLGAGKPISGSLLCRWNLYGPIDFEPASENACIGTLVAQPPNRRDADFDVEIVNPTDMHAVGYAIGKMIMK